MERKISIAKQEEFQKEFSSNPINKVAMHAVTHNGLLDSAKTWQGDVKNHHNYSLYLDQGPVTNQEKSGRCWMFATMNILRYEVIKSLGLKNFELSQNYMLFYDKLEKSNYLLESVLDTLDEPLQGRLICHLLADPLGDGGQWDMICNLMNKYGVVPKEAMPETKCSSNTGEMTSVLTEKLREFTCILRKDYEQGKTRQELLSQKEKMMEEIYRILCICLGKPPVTFDFEVMDKNHKMVVDRNLTPQEFMKKYIPVSINDYVSLINAPTSDKPFYRSYSVKFLGNVVEGRPVRYVNVPIEVMKKAAIAQMKDGHPVWFGCDVGKELLRDEGIMAMDAYDKESLLGTKFTLNKGERVEYGQSLMTHAMVFTGVNIQENGLPNRWRVENSWGKESGDNGFYLMTDEWFDEYMYQVVVNRKYLEEEVLKAYESDPILLEPWDPMGSLAKVRG